MSKNNVIEFPMKKKPQNPHTKIRLDLEHNRVTLTASLVSVLLFVTWANHSLFRSSENQSSQEIAQSSESPGNLSRGIASVVGNSARIARVPRDAQWEQSVAENLATRSVSSQGRSGSVPAELDQFSYGLLQGRYFLKLNGNHVQALLFAPVNSSESPIAIGDPIEFLKKNQDRFEVKFREVLVLDHQSGNIKNYALFDEDFNVIGQAHFELDSLGRMQSLRVEKNSKK